VAEDPVDSRFSSINNSVSTIGASSWITRFLLCGARTFVRNTAAASGSTDDGDDDDDDADEVEEDAAAAWRHTQTLLALTVINWGTRSGVPDRCLER